MTSLKKKQIPRLRRPTRSQERTRQKSRPAPLGMTIYGGLGGLWGGLGNLTPTGLKTGQYLVNEFSARGMQGSVGRWGRL